MKKSSHIKSAFKRVVEWTPYRVLHKNNSAFVQAAAEEIVPNRANTVTTTKKKFYVSLVIVAYNSEEYLSRLLFSIFNQSDIFSDFEIIIIDRGSTDGTQEIIDDWIMRQPGQIRSLSKANIEMSAARNIGLKMANSIWIAFPDASDFLHKNFFKSMMHETKIDQKNPLLAVVSNVQYYLEDRDQFSDTHPLRYRFQDGTVHKLAGDLGQFVQTDIRNCWINFELLKRYNVEFDIRVSGPVGGGHLLNSLFLIAANRTVSFLPKAIHYQRSGKKKAQETFQNASHASWYIEDLKFGILDILEKSKLFRGDVPVQIQRSALYEVFSKVKYIVNHNERISGLSSDEKLLFLSLTREILSYVDVRTIETFHLNGFTEEHKVAFLAQYKHQPRSTTSVYLVQIDKNSGLVQFSYFTTKSVEGSFHIFINELEVQPVLPSRSEAKIIDNSYFVRKLFWIRMTDDDEVRFELDGTLCRIKWGGVNIGLDASWIQLRNAMNRKVSENLSADLKQLRKYVIDKKPIYHGCSVFMDQPDKADDNAEHLYRHMQATGQADHAWFILDAESSDWHRLDQEGFKLLAFGSDDHVAAQMNADLLISSHLSEANLFPVARSAFSDLVRYQFVFLQHGVILTDLSRLINVKPVRIFVTTTPAEHAAISSPDGPYIFSEREVMLTGLPRHDALLEKAQTATADTILIMPTWRRYLTDEPVAPGMPRQKKDDFLESDYATNWLSVLNSPQLHKIARRNALRIVFALHPNMKMYLEEMDLPDSIEIANFDDGSSYQDLFVSAKIAITDYSSAATELAFLQRPVVYFQFDQDDMFGGAHTVQQGYFSFEDDGFGPVVRQPKEVVMCLEAALAGREDPIYSQRRVDSMPFRDGRCCERVSLAINRLQHPNWLSSPLYVTHGSEN